MKKIQVSSVTYIEGIIMLSMIPPYYKENISSNAEKKVFGMLQKLNINGAVFHSLGIAEHRDKIFGEIDFLLICEKGILCLEIKGGFVRREQGIWKYEDRHGNITSKEEGPFQQAIGNMFSVRDYLGKILGKNHPALKSQFACGVLFPDMTFNQKGIDIIPEIIFDGRYTDNQMTTFIDNTFDYWRTKIQTKHEFVPGKLNIKIIKQLENLLRGDFSCVPSLSLSVDEVDNKLISLTNEQFNTFKMIANNPRIIVSGSAGTGKTLIAIEQAKRFAIQGKKVLYLCFNRVLSSYLKYQIQNDPLSESISKFKIYTLHELLNNYVDYSDIHDFDSDDFYRNIVPERFLEYIEFHTIEKFDAILIDEGQDLIRENYLMCIDEFLHNGLDDGNWYVFFDENQNIYNPHLKEGMEILERNRPTRINLVVNCRNTKQIATYNKLLTGLEQSELMKVSGEQVSRKSYDNSDELQKSIQGLVKSYLKDGISPGDIVILSPYTLSKSGLNGPDVFKSICKFQDISRMKFNTTVPDAVKFSTIHSFKGMESKVVILIDLNKFSSAEVKRLNYTAISRARVMLNIFYDSNAEDEINNVIKESLQTII
jgi:cellulose biosynthesis protein BcsQ